MASFGQIISGFVGGEQDTRPADLMRLVRPKQGSTDGAEKDQLRQSGRTRAGEVLGVLVTAATAAVAAGNLAKRSPNALRAGAAISAGGAVLWAQRSRRRREERHAEESRLHNEQKAELLSRLTEARSTRDEAIAERDAALAKEQAARRDLQLARGDELAAKLGELAAVARANKAVEEFEKKTAIAESSRTKVVWITPEQEQIQRDVADMALIIATGPKDDNGWVTLSEVNGLPDISVMEHESRGDNDPMLSLIIHDPEVVQAEQEVYDIYPDQLLVGPSGGDDRFYLKPEEHQTIFTIVNGHNEEFMSRPFVPEQTPSSVSAGVNLR